ncbi:hypothetical protein TEA_011301 [Camellia sinensis var. sinensis]|uniref:Aspartyl aminopeptidase n=1 Tax=Camellia sinensis var. sinensis TaxID=542762 RepID=A0A4S4D6G5_CAMSN|nr:hypothetical protein TEA_011301 [Camellia sinensis var. sinensis]
MAKHQQSKGTSSVAADLVDFLNASPTAFHAVGNANALLFALFLSPLRPVLFGYEAKKRLTSAGYEQVSEREDWSLEAGKTYFFTRNHSTIVAFAIGKKYVAGNGFHVIGAHTDSPCLKLKPVSKVSKGGYLEVGVQTYGGGLWHTWFDRDLTVAGRLIIREGKDGNVSYSHRLVRIAEPIMRIPTLAIHLDRDVNDGFKVNTQSHLVPVLATSIKAELNKVVFKNSPAESGSSTDGNRSNEKSKTDNQKHHSLLLQARDFIYLLAAEVGCEPDDICDFELQACDTQPSIIAGATKEFIFSGRLDNLCMSFCSLKALIDSTSSESSLDMKDWLRVVALFDHEEVGSNSAQGAGLLPCWMLYHELQVPSVPILSLTYHVKGNYWNCSSALIDSTSSESSLDHETGVRVVALFDHEEVGSNSAQGAGSPAMLDALSRITSSFSTDSKLLEKAIQRSFLVSADMAHALHPNYMDKHEDNHQPKLHGGLVIKHNANQRYATNAVTSFIFREIAIKHNLPIQDFVVRNDMPCGSTIGPILASGTGIRTVDIGAPQLSMHSIREMCGVDDVKHSYEHFKAFFQEFCHVDTKIVVDI